MKKLMMGALAASTVLGAVVATATPAAAQPWGYWHRPHYGYWHPYRPYYGYGWGPRYYGHPYWHGYGRYHRW